MNFSKEFLRLSTTEQSIIAKHQNELPIPVGQIAKELGLTVNSSTLPAGISGEIKLVDSNYVIRVNRHDIKARQRFTVAHEIAHYLLHRDLIGDGISDDILYRSALSDTLEAEANRLAADILMPLGIINAQLSLHQDKKSEQRYEIVANLADVSLAALKIRLGKA